MALLKHFLLFSLFVISNANACDTYSVTYEIGSNCGVEILNIYNISQSQVEAKSVIAPSTFTYFFEEAGKQYKGAKLFRNNAAVCEIIDETTQVGVAIYNEGPLPRTESLSSDSTLYSVEIINLCN